MTQPLSLSEQLRAESCVTAYFGCAKKNELLRAAASRLERVEAALKPFAAKSLERPGRDDDHLVTIHLDGAGQQKGPLRVGDFRKARAQDKKDQP